MIFLLEWFWQTMGSFLIALGALRGARKDHCLSLGHPWTSFWGSWGGLGSPFWGSGGTPGRVRRAVVAKDPSLFPPRLVLSDFGAKREPQRVPTFS